MCQRCGPTQAQRRAILRYRASDIMLCGTDIRVRDSNSKVATFEIYTRRPYPGRPGEFLTEILDSVAVTRRGRLLLA